MAIEKKRLDSIVLELHPQYSRTQIQSWILQKKIFVDGVPQTKAGTMVKPDAVITLNIEDPKYVSRGGFKLEKALDHFGIDVTGLVALDAGISTGGFTDCLLQGGVSKVYGIDVGYGQVHEKILYDPRLVIKEKVNLRTLAWRHQPVDLVTLDLSFISILKVMPAISQLIKPTGMIIALIKPQFEAERHEIGAKGLVKRPEVHERVKQKIIDGMAEFGFICKGIIESPIKGAASGNTEFLGLFVGSGMLTKVPANSPESAE